MQLGQPVTAQTELEKGRMMKALTAQNCNELSSLSAFNLKPNLPHFLSPPNLIATLLSCC